MNEPSSTEDGVHTPRTVRFPEEAVTGDLGARLRSRLREGANSRNRPSISVSSSGAQTPATTRSDGNDQEEAQ
jgi:hypothetical protein